MRRQPGLIAGLDTAHVATAIGWADAVAPSCALIKLGLEFFMANGPAGVQALGDRPIFLDLKLHDIPNTVAGAVSSVLPLRPAMLTLHASGGAAMMAAARRAADASDAPPMLLGVTVLTSLDAETLHATGVAGGSRQQVLRLARLALGEGADGLVCSAHEAAMLRDAFGDKAMLVVPGIRPAGSASGDQARVMTPGDAVAAGADYLVVGRPISAASDPRAAAAAILAEMRSVSPSAGGDRRGTG